MNVKLLLHQAEITYFVKLNKNILYIRIIFTISVLYVLFCDNQKISRDSTESEIFFLDILDIEGIKFSCCFVETHSFCFSRSLH